MIEGVLIMLTVVLTVASVIAIIVTAARDRSPAAADPGIGTVRRLFLYLLAAAGLVTAANGASWLVQAAFGVLTPLADLSRATTVALGIALTTVGTPTWLVFWLLAQRSVRDHPVEVRYLMRKLYLYGLMTGAAIATLVAAVRVLAWALGATAFDPAPMATLVVWGAIWVGHGALEAREGQATDVARIVRQLHTYVLLLLGLTSMAFAGADVIRQVLAAAYDAWFGGPLVFSSQPVLWDDAVRVGIAGTLVGGALWGGYGQRVARPDRDGWPRTAYLYAFGILPGTVAVVAATSVGLYQLLQWGFGVPGVATAYERFAVLPGVLATLVVAGGVWGFHGVVARREAAAAPIRARAGRRISGHLLAAVGLGALVTGLTYLISTVLGLLASTSGPNLRGDRWRDPLILAVTLLAVGAPLWASAWRGLQRRARADPAEERPALTRRVYLYAITTASVVAAQVASSVELYRWLAAVLGDDAVARTSWLFRAREGLAIAATAAAVGVFHALVLRADRRTAPAALEAEVPAAPDVVLLVRGTDVAAARAWARDQAGRVTIWVRAEEGPATFAPAAVERALEAVPDGVPRALVRADLDAVEVVAVRSD